ncbi:hypothetical protein [Bdellovibrio sp. HCB337]|uniref:hypothetical protein n=1 Tax=Bdellovibrio sp. HCB337 TaxID=3394358 RepID=UPI0039A51179
MNNRKPFFILSLILSSSLLWGFSTAKAVEEIKDFDAVRIDGIDNTVLEPKSPDAPQEHVTFTYDPSALADAPPVQTTLEELQKISQEMQGDAYKAKLKSEVVIPVSTDSPENLAALTVLKPEEVNTFISKKNHFLAKIAKILTTLRLKATSVNKMVHLMNEQFFKNAGVIANANARVLSIQIGVAGGVGLADWLMVRLKKSPYLRNLPDTAGFYFLFSTGFSIVKTTHNGKTRLSIEPIVEFRRATRIFSPFLFGAAGLTASYNWENRAESTSIQKATFYRISSLNAVSGVQQFGFSGAAAVAFPPGGGAAAGMEGEIYRVRITREMLPKLVDMMKGFLGKSKVRSCEGVFVLTTH